MTTPAARVSEASALVDAFERLTAGVLRRRGIGPDRCRRCRASRS